MRKQPDQEPDWPFLQQGPVTLVRSANVLQDALTRLRSSGYRTYDIDGSSDAACAASFAKALHWEAKFGYVPEALNLDALNDAFYHDPAHDADRTLLVFRNFDSLRKRSRATAHGILDVFTHNEREHLIYGLRLLCFVQTSDPDLRIDGLGGRSAHWNSEEWQDRKRRRGAGRR